MTAICIVFILLDPEIIYLGRCAGLEGNSKPFSVRDLSSLDFDICGGPGTNPPHPLDTKG
jgi:hypothetical protein